LSNTHIAISRVEYEGGVCGFTPARQWRRKIGYDAMTTSATPYHHIGGVEECGTEVLVAARNGEDIIRRIHIRENISENLERDALQTRQ